MADNYDYDLEAANIKRRQAVLESMQSGALAPMQFAPANQGGQASPTHWTNALAKLAQGYAAKKGQEEVTNRQQALSSRYSDDLRAGMEAYDKTARGGVTSNGDYGPMADGSTQGGTTSITKGDPRKAIYDAMASNHPVLRDFAMKQMAEQAKGQLTPVELAKMATPESVLKNPNDPRSWSPERKLQFATPGSIPVDAGGNATTLGGTDLTNPGWKTVNIGGDLYQQTATGLKKLDNAPKINNNISTNVINKGETKFMEGVGTANAKAFEEAKAAKVGAQRTIQSMQKLEQLEQQGVLSGPTADISMTLGSLAQAVGMPVNTKKLATSQAYQGELMANLGAQLTGSLARSTTDKDMEILKAPLPQLLGSPEGRAALRRQAIAKANEHIQYAESVQQNLVQAYPEAARLLQTSPGEVPVPMRSDLDSPSGRVVKWGDLK